MYDIVWYRNPRHHLPPEVLHLVDMVLRFTRYDAQSGTGSLAFLPDAGGIQDQAAVILDMIDIITAAVRDISHAIRA